MCLYLVHAPTHRRASPLIPTGPPQQNPTARTAAGTHSAQAPPRALFRLQHCLPRTARAPWGGASLELVPPSKRSRCRGGRGQGAGRGTAPCAPLPGAQGPGGGETSSSRWPSPVSRCHRPQRHPPPQRPSSQGALASPLSPCPSVPLSRCHPQSAANGRPLPMTERRRAAAGHEVRGLAALGRLHPSEPGALGKQLLSFQPRKEGLRGSEEPHPPGPWPL